ncbi:hypothetical protein F441_18851 [Phytophthora nicotianae CJ01A1]|uniref:Uncharacterized protein n=2 Tax=Phytophthora nicotianae TaxID=4792 RepID=W2W1U6_PHYNI|nr:hypothetical protein L915_18464 [Phytophthora nicotianae]ETP04381.1 hypothetical protein F441_18851 [Phytophthora nicotianae CJ01A1]
MVTVKPEQRSCIPGNVVSRAGDKAGPQKDTIFVLFQAPK